VSQKSAYGRWMALRKAGLIVNEDCRWCGRPSQMQHPAGVVRGQWFCRGCHREQKEEGS
jgi:hypothetical protein